MISNDPNKVWLTGLTRGDADDLAVPMHSARVSPDAATDYATQMSGGSNALLVVRAGFYPIGAARNAIKITGRTPSLGAGLADENQYIREDGDYAARSSVMKDHTLWMSNPHCPTSHGHILGSNPISASRTNRSALADQQIFLQ